MFPKSIPGSLLQSNIHPGMLHPATGVTSAASIGYPVPSTLTKIAPGSKRGSQDSQQPTCSYVHPVAPFATPRWEQPNNIEFQSKSPFVSRNALGHAAYDARWATSPAIHPAASHVDPPYPPTKISARGKPRLSHVLEAKTREELSAVDGLRTLDGAISKRQRKRLASSSAPCKYKCVDCHRGFKRP